MSKRLSKNLLARVLFVLLAVSVASANSFLKTNGRIIVNEQNEKIILKGFGLGGWLVLEGYIWNCNIEHASTTNIENEIESLIGPEKKEQFFDLYRKNYITEYEISLLADHGFNAIRVPLHYKHFSPSYGTFTNIGFDLLDPLIEYCRDNDIYLILDMHAAPGGQNTNDFSDSDGEEARLFTEPENQLWLASTWRYIAEYYADEPVIGAYDLLNEPARWGIANTLRNIYERVVDSIRVVDPNHIVIIEGNWFGNDHTGLLPPFDDEMVYSFHHYIGSSSDSVTSSNPSHWMHQYITDISIQYDVPLWIGEFGENSNHWAFNKKNFFERHDIGWSWWNFKSIERISSLFSYEITDEYKVLIDYWNGSGTKPDTTNAFNGLISMANSLKFDSCWVNKGLSRALMDSNYNSVSFAYSSFKPPGLLPAVNYDTGNNNVAYFDTQIEDPSKFSPETQSWNNGWSYRNDGVDIGSTMINGKINYFVGWIEDDEWLKYSIDVEDPGNFKILVEIASFINGSKIALQIDSSTTIGPITLPNTNGWDNGWRVVEIGNVSLTKDAKIKLIASTGGFNLRNIIFENLDVSSVPMNLKLNCFPNPVNSELSIFWESDFVLDTEIEIYDISGKLIYESRQISKIGTNSLDWNLKSNSGKAIPSGIFLVKISTANAESMKKVTHLK